MHRRAEVDRLIQRPAFDADLILRRQIAVPAPAAAMGAEMAMDAAAAVGGAGPDLGSPLGEVQIGAANRHRDAESRGGLPPALPAMANIDRPRLATDFVADLAALAAAGEGQGGR